MLFVSLSSLDDKTNSLFTRKSNGGAYHALECEEKDVAVGTSRPKLKLNYIFCFERLMNVCSVVNVLDQICRFILMPGWDQLWKNGRSCLNKTFSPWKVWKRIQLKVLVKEE